MKSKIHQYHKQIQNSMSNKITIVLLPFFLFIQTDSFGQSVFKTPVDSITKKSVVAKKPLPEKLISISPFSLFNKVKFQYERVINKQISAGAGGYFVFSDYMNSREIFGNNFRKKGGVNAFLRWYPLGKAPTGIYFQPKITMHYCSNSVNYYQYQTVIDTSWGGNYSYQEISDTKTIERSYGIYVGSIDLGGQWLIANRVPIDISIGLRAAIAEHVSFNTEETIQGKIYTREEYYYQPRLTFVGMPGFPIGMSFNVGFAF